MATFAKLEKRPDPFDSSTERWTVMNVIKVGNKTPTSDGPLGDNDMHIDGENWCKNFFQGGTWKQTSAGHAFRGRMAMIGGTYDFAADKFIERQPFASWIKQDDGVTWKAPVPYPTITTYKDNGADVNYNIFWNENDLEWKALDWDSPRNTFTWDSSNLVWIQQ